MNMLLLPIISLLLKIALLLSLGLILDSVLQRFEAKLREKIWLLTFFSITILPLLTSILPNIPVYYQTVVTQDSSTIVAPIEPPQLEVKTSHQTTTESVSTQKVNPFPWTIFIHIVYVFGVLTMVGSQIVAFLQRRKWKSEGQIASANLQALFDTLKNKHLQNHKVCLLVSSQQHSPLTWGLRHHTVLLPVSSRNWSNEEIAFVFLHEFAHIKRNDYLRNQWIIFLETCYWFLPFIWFAHRRMLLATEEICDTFVLSNHTIQTNYASFLLSLTKTIQRTSHFSSKHGVITMAQKTTLKRRIETILTPKKLNKNQIVMSILLLFICFASLALSPLRLETKQLQQPNSDSKRAVIQPETPESIPSNEYLEMAEEKESLDETTQEPPFKVRGRVVMENDKPAPGAQVIIHNTQLGAATDILGRFTILVPDSISGEVTVTAFYLGFDSVSKSIQLQDHEEIAIEFKLRRDGTSYATYIDASSLLEEPQDAETGSLLGSVYLDSKEAAGVTVLIDRKQTIKTDQDGLFMASNLSPGTHTFEPILEGYQRRNSIQQLLGLKGSEAKVVIEKGKRSQYIFRLEPVFEDAGFIWGDLGDFHSKESKQYANIIMDGLGLSIATSGYDGKVYFMARNIKPGRHTLMFSNDTFKLPTPIEFEIKAGEILRVNLPIVKK